MVAVAVGDSNDCYTCAICGSRLHGMPACCICEPGWMYVLYHLINDNKVYINRRTIKKCYHMLKVMIRHLPSLMRKCFESKLVVPYGLG